MLICDELRTHWRLDVLRIFAASRRACLRTLLLALPLGIPCALPRLGALPSTEEMPTTDTVLKLSSFPVCKRRPWAYHLLANLASTSRRRVQRRTRQAGRQAVAKQALDAETADQMRRTGENIQEAFASGNPDTLRQSGDEMMEVNAC